MRPRPGQIDRAEAEPAEQRHLEEIETEDKNRPSASGENEDKQRRHQGPAQGRDEEGER